MAPAPLTRFEDQHSVGNWNHGLTCIKLHCIPRGATRNRTDPNPNPRNRTTDQHALASIRTEPTEPEETEPASNPMEKTACAG